jgi:hypothetical protein
MAIDSLAFSRGHALVNLRTFLRVSQPRLLSVRIRCHPWLNLSNLPILVVEREGGGPYIWLEIIERDR